MDVKNVKAAIDAAHRELNVLIDAEFAARRTKGLRALEQAAGALTLAGKHVDTAAQRVQPKPAPVAPATGKK